LAPGKPDVIMPPDISPHDSNWIGPPRPDRPAAPTPTGDVRPPVRFVAGSGPDIDDDTARVLQARLRILTILGLAVLALMWASIEFSSLRFLASAGMRMVFLTVILLQAGMIAAVWWRSDLSLLRLRIIEIAGVVLFLAIEGTDLWNSLTADDFKRFLSDPVQQAYFGHSMSVSWIFGIVSYGMFIPNTGRRCALMVGLFLAVPIAVTLAAGRSDSGRGEALFGPYLFSFLLSVGVAAVLAIFSSGRQSMLREEAFAARQLGQYQLKRKLGAGGMGEVYLAEHQLLRRRCAVKLIRPERAGDRTLLLRFEREVRAMARLTHWNTVEVFDYGRTDDGTFYYVMEYLPGMNLEDMVKEHGPLPAGRVIHLLRQICSALSEAHAAGLVHRDIKPSNVIVCRRGRVFDVVKLVDFGLVRVTTRGESPGHLTMEGSVLGTPLYMSPEQSEGSEQVDHHSDIYSLGAVGYFLLTGRPPFVHDNLMKVLAAHMLEAVRPLTDWNPAVPADVQDIILRCLAKRPADRFASVDVLDGALASCTAAGTWSSEHAGEWWQQHPEKEPIDGKAAPEPVDADAETLMR
jgi:serine/threonine-protein kinase